MSRFVILMYHMVSDPEDDRERRYACPPARFAEHMALLRQGEFNPVSLDDIHGSLDGTHTLPPNAVAVTLDDGFEDNYKHAFPVLDKYRIPATIFLASGMMGKSNLWMQKLGYQKHSMLDWDQIKTMAQSPLMTFGAHTASHAKLTELEHDDLAQEISQSKQRIEEVIGASVNYFAYPYGQYSQQAVEMVKKYGFKIACTTDSGFNNKTTNPLRLKRIEVYGADSVRNLTNKLRFGANQVSTTDLIRYYWQRLGSCLSANQP